jgi:hypothetical protein
MTCESGASLATMAVEHIDHTTRKASLAHKLGEREDTQRGLLRRLKHDGIPRRQSWAELPRGHEEGIVPGDDLRTHAEGLAEGVGELVGAAGDGVAVELVGPAGVVAEGCRDFGNVEEAACVVGLAVVEGLDCGETVEVGVDEVGEAVEEAGAEGGVEGPGFCEGGAGGEDGGVDIFFCGGADGADFLFGAGGVNLGLGGGCEDILQGVDGGHRLAVAAFDELVVDEEPCRLFPLEAVECS